MILALASFFALTPVVGPPITNLNTSPAIISAVTNTAAIKTNSAFVYTETTTSSGVSGKQWQFRSAGAGTVVSAHSESPSIATVDSSGVVMFQSAGQATFGVVIHDIASGGSWGSSVVLSNLTVTGAQTVNGYVSNHFASLNHHVFTNLIARTNGKTMALWSAYPATFAARSNFVRNPDCFLNGTVGLTAISQCWTAQSGRGQIPVTALTRRHGYLRGHGMGANPGQAITNSGLAGEQVAFVTTSNSIATMTISNRVTRWDETGDYTIVSFTDDLPVSITPMTVATNFNPFTPSLYPYYGTNAVYLFPPNPWLRVEQQGNIDTSASPTGTGDGSGGLPGFKYASVKAGDSGSPDMLIVGDTLIFTGGRTTSPASVTMQRDMDHLCNMAGLNPASYQMTWFSMSGFPYYE